MSFELVCAFCLVLARWLGGWEVGWGGNGLAERAAGGGVGFKEGGREVERWERRWS